LRTLPIPVPPLSEQAQIAVEVERRLRAAEQLDISLQQQQSRARTTQQMLLREALAGLLAPQDPDDEPASKLLDRIQTEKYKARTVHKTVNRASPRTNENKSVPMQEIPPSPDALRAAWNTIGKKTDARRLFDAAGLRPEQVVQFYEVLRATEDLRAAFQKQVKGRQDSLKRSRQLNEPVGKSAGQFRLIKLWLEDFNNLIDSKLRRTMLGRWLGFWNSADFSALKLIMPNTFFLHSLTKRTQRSERFSRSD
jgi:hypothetical protein